MALFTTYTDQPYIGTEGKVFRADRAYLAPIATAAPGAAAGGATPGGWTDLGSIDESLSTLDKADSDIIDVRTGVYEVLRDQVAKQDGTVTAKLTMVEYDPAAWGALTGDATVAVGAGTAVFVGGRPLLSNAFLLIGQNLPTETEYQHWNPQATLTWKVVDVNRFTGIEVTAHFLKFTDVGDAAALSRDFKLTLF